MVDIHLFHNDLANEKLCKNVEAIFGKYHTVHIADLYGCLKCRQFNQVIDRLGDESGTRDASYMVPGSTDSL